MNREGQPTIRGETTKLTVEYMVALLVCLAQPGQGADALNQWVVCNPLPTCNALNAVAYGNGQFVHFPGNDECRRTR
jgi:hypothetical protein